MVVLNHSKMEASEGTWFRRDIQAMTLVGICTSLRLVWISNSPPSRGQKKRIKKRKGKEVTVWFCVPVVIENELRTYGCCFQKLYPHLDQGDACTNFIYRLYSLFLITHVFLPSVFPVSCAQLSLGFSGPGLSLSLLITDIVMDSHSAFHLPLMMNYTAYTRSSAAINWLRNTEINIHQPRIGFCVCISTSFFFNLFGCFELAKAYKVLQIYFCFVSHVTPIICCFSYLFLMCCIIIGYHFILRSLSGCDFWSNFPVPTFAFPFITKNRLILDSFLMKERENT